MSDYIDFLKEVFATFGPVNSRRMFGGHGLYYDGLMFALVAQDTLYLKADAENQHFFDAEGLEKFSYEKQGKSYSIAYFQAPDQLFDDQDEAAIWARRSWDAAVRGAAKKRRSN
tara:strand:+ start:43895 stop:44236 length:342 start_codon:yes stop_codon:yes gene_type:complete